MKLLTAKQMTELERVAILQYGIDGLLLMENAARSFCDTLEENLWCVSGKTVAIFCGKGNNGGDGFAIGRHLHNRGASVTFFVGCIPDKPDAKKNYDIIMRMGLPVLAMEDVKNSHYDLVIDALFGTGFHGTPKAEAATWINTMNDAGNTIASVDIPSGADASTGAVTGACVKATLTVTFATAKPGHYLYPAKEFCGKVFVTDISIPRQVCDDFEANFFTLDAELANVLPKRTENSHKGSYGKALIYAGSTGMTGACIMAATATLKSGVGMVTAAIPETIQNTVSARFTEIMTMPLPCSNTELTEDAGKMILEKLKTQDVLLAGCGIGITNTAKKTLLDIVSVCQKPMVIDADGINALSGHIHVIQNKAIPPVLTPHPLEFSRISGLSVEYILENRLQVAREFSYTHQVVLVLKGADTIVAHPNGNIYICPQSNSGLAKAGSGDVLAGVITALLAQGASPSDAANLGVYLHSRAGMLAREKNGAYGMSASDVIQALSHVMTELAEW